MEVECAQSNIGCNSAESDADLLVKCSEPKTPEEAEYLEPNLEESDESSLTQEDIEVEQILKGILKPARSWDHKNKKVNWDLKLRYIPWDENKDFTIDIEIVKEIPKKVVSYREVYRKMAQEKAEAERKAEAAAKGEVTNEEEDTDDEVDICFTDFKFGKLKVISPGREGRLSSPAPIVDITLDEKISIGANASETPEMPSTTVRYSSLEAINANENENSSIATNPSCVEYLGSFSENGIPQNPENVNTNHAPISKVSRNNSNATDHTFKNITGQNESISPANILVTGPDGRRVPNSLDETELPVISEDTHNRVSIPHNMDAKMVSDAPTFVRSESRSRLASISEEVLPSEVLPS